MSLKEYRQKRDFQSTGEPLGSTSARTTGHRYVVQKHAARRLHYDLRLELNGVLKSWAVPKGPSLDPNVKVLAVQVEDHPLEYANFEGIIPKGQYGGGTVMVWDQGEWQSRGDAEAGLKRGRLTFELHGEKLKGGWSLIRMKEGSRPSDQKNWLLVKRDDAEARDSEIVNVTIVDELSTSVVSGRSLEEIAADCEITEPTGRKGSGRRRTQSATNAHPSSIDVDQLPAARKAKLPEDLLPQLATPASAIPEGDEWLHELKFDGYRLLCFVDSDGIRLKTRRANDWTDRFPTIAKAVRQMALSDTILDGELVALDDRGISDFQKLQNWIQSRRESKLVYYVFDVPYFSGFNLQKSPLSERKELLARFLLTYRPGNDGTIRYSDHIQGQGPEVLHNSCRHALEGVISKRADSPYESRRTRSWLKSKCLGRQEFVIGGFTKPQGSRTGFGALLVGYREGQRWIYCGRVGTGFSQRSLASLSRQLKNLIRETPPFDNAPTGTQARGVSWTEPELVAEVEFTNWTDDGLLRHPTFQGLREDKAANEVVREVATMNPPVSTPARKRSTVTNRSKTRATASGNSVAGVGLTHPDRIMYPGQGITKRQLAEYYEQIADFVLPFVINRPLTLVRCPQGRTKQCFFQKHWKESLPDFVENVVVEEKDEPARYVVIHNVEGLISLVQMSTLEFHPWNARTDKLDRPDQIVFDLDPGEGVSWNAVKEAAIEVREFLKGAELQSFVRTSGGKGLHVVVPMTRRNSWNEVGLFAENAAKTLAKRTSDRYVAKSRKSLRTGRIFIDYLRNKRGATSVACYSTRARSGAPVATPLEWSELDDLKAADQWTVENVPQRLQSRSAPVWEDFSNLRQSITKSALSIVDGSI